MSLTNGGEKLRIRQLREQIGMSQEELATALGVSRTTVTMWENGHSMPPASKLPTIAAFFKCKIDDLYDNGREGIT